MRIAPVVGGTGESLLRQTRMTGEPTLRILFTDLTLHFDEHSTVAQIEGVRPVRSARSARCASRSTSARCSRICRTGTTQTYLYGEGFDSPAHISVRGSS